MSNQAFSGYGPDGLVDVEEFVREIHGGSSLSWDRCCQVSDLVEMGNRAFQQNHFEEAISYYSGAHNVKPGDPIVLGNRSAAYIRISQFVKQRPPSASEYKPLNGLDPTTHAELALKDAEKVMKIQSNSVKPYILKANALVLLEKYELARDVVLSGLQVDPQSNALQASLENLQRTPNILTRKRGHGMAERTDDFDCTLCLKLLYEPITTPCGHSFCRPCLFQSMDRGDSSLSLSLPPSLGNVIFSDYLLQMLGNKCPLCRTVLFLNPRTCAISDFFVRPRGLSTRPIGLVDQASILLLLHHRRKW